MTAAVVTVDMSKLVKLQARIDRLIGLIGDELPEAIGALLESSARERIESSKRAPDGKPWDSWSPAYADTRPPGGSLLQRSGALVDATQFEVSGDTITLYTALEYAAPHQFGDPGRNIPARPWLGISDQDVRDIDDLVDGMTAEVLG